VLQFVFVLLVVCICEQDRHCGRTSLSIPETCLIITASLNSAVTSADVHASPPGCTPRLQWGSVVAWSSTAATTGFVRGHRAPVVTNNRRTHRDTRHRCARMCKRSNLPPAFQVQSSPLEAPTTNLAGPVATPAPCGVICHMQPANCKNPLLYHPGMPVVLAQHTEDPIALLFASPIPSLENFVSFANALPGLLRNLHLASPALPVMPVRITYTSP
jgi:hypothetical protein